MTSIALSTQIIPIKQIRTSFSHLRSTVSSVCPVGLVQMPIRVTPCRTEPEHYEVVDGFKRFRDACEAGLEEINVVVDESHDVKDAKRLLLKANSPRRTLSAMDEARVVKSLIEDDGLTPTAASRFLKRKRSWASKRYTLAIRLDKSLQKEIDKNRLTVSLAYSLCRFKKIEQLQVAKAIFQGGLSSTNGLALITTYNALDGKEEKRRLLHDPMGTLSEIAVTKKKSNLSLSHTASGKLDRYNKLKELLEEFENDSISETILPAEARLLKAERTFLKAKIIMCGQTLSGMVPEKLRTKVEIHEDKSYGSRHNSRDLPVEEKRHEEEGNCKENWSQYKND